MKKHDKLGNVVSFVTLLLLISGTVLLAPVLSDHKDAECEHSFSEFKETVAPSDFRPGEKVKHCVKCHFEITETVNATVKLPQLYLDGNIDGIAKDSAVMLYAKYYDSDTVFESHVNVRYQGHTSILFDKKNYTLQFYKSDQKHEKNDVSINGWDATHKYYLKANYIDFSSARNIVSSNIWSDVVLSRKKLDNNIARLEFAGGLDGFPVALFINGRYQGLYTFNIPKDNSTYDIADDKNEAMFVINSIGSDAANFRSLMTEEDKAAVFDLEYAYDESSEAPYISLDRLIGFVMENDGDSFTEGIEKHLDVDAAIDYLITAYVLGLTDNFSKNMILLTYDGERWIPNLYDLDTACGLVFDGSGYLPFDFSLPSVTEEGRISSGTDNLLWDRILNNYTERFKLRYTELRSDILATEKLIARYSEFISSIPFECYEYETTLYPDAPNASVDQIKQITDFLTARCELLDSLIYNFNSGDAVK